MAACFDIILPSKSTKCILRQPINFQNARPCIPLRLPPLALVWPFSSLDRTLPQRHLHTGLYMIQRLDRIRNREELSFIHSGKFYQPRYRDKSCSYNQSGVKSSDQIFRRIQFCRNVKTLESFSHQNKHFFSGEQSTLELKR